MGLIFIQLITHTKYLAHFITLVYGHMYIEQ